MKIIDSFLARHEIDVGRSLGLLMLAGAVISVFDVIGALFVGRINIDLSGPIGLVLGLALWRHMSWARTLTIVVTWAVAGLFTCLLAILPITGTGNLRLTVGSTVVQHPPVWQVYCFGVLIAPVIWLFLCVLHSERAKFEFKKAEPGATAQRL